MKDQLLYLQVTIDLFVNQVQVNFQSALAKFQKRS